MPFPKTPTQFSFFYVNSMLADLRNDVNRPWKVAENFRLSRLGKSLTEHTHNRVALYVCLQFTGIVHILNASDLLKNKSYKIT